MEVAPAGPGEPLCPLNRRLDSELDTTQTAVAKSPVSNAILVTSIGLGAGNVGFISGIFGNIAGHQSLYAATATGTSAAVVAFGIGVTIATFVRKNNAD